MEQVSQALDGDTQAQRDLIRRLRPAVELGVSSALRHDARVECRDHRQEVRDFVQDVFLSLFSDHGRALKRWNPARGRSLESFVRLVAQRLVSTALRSRRRSPWSDRPVACDVLERRVVDEALTVSWLESSNALEHVLEHIERRLDARGRRLFEMLFVEERSVDEVMTETSMTRDAVYAWRLRFRRLVAALAPEVLN